MAGSRKRTKARETYTETSMARGLLRMLAAMMAPCSVKARDRYLRCWPRPGASMVLASKVANCDLKAAHSSAVRANTKSAGNLARLRLTASLSRLVGTS